MFENISVIGGDLRQLTVAKLLKAEGYHVFLYGFDKDIQLETLECETDKDLVLSADIVILPVPVTFDGNTINSPYAKEPMIIDDFLSEINPSALVFGGQIQPNLQKALEDNHIAYRDYLKREELSIKNAVPTALVIWVLMSILQVLCKYKIVQKNLFKWTELNSVRFYVIRKISTCQ